MVRRDAARIAVSHVLFSSHSQIICKREFPVGYRCGTKGVLQRSQQHCHARRHQPEGPSDVRDGSQRRGQFPLLH